MDQIRREGEGLWVFLQLAVGTGLVGYVLYGAVAGALLFLKNLCCC